MPKNEAVRRELMQKGVEWDELATSLHMRQKELVRLMNGTTISPSLRRRVMDAIRRISSRSEAYYFYGED